MSRPDIIFLRHYVSSKEEYGDLENVGAVEISNGLCWLAAVSRDAGFDTEILDAQALMLHDDKVIDLLKERAPKYVGLTIMTPFITHVIELLGKLKSTLPQIKTIVGGPHITAVPEETMQKIKYIDFGVVGEGEETIVELIRALEEKKEDLSSIKGIVFRKGPDIIKTEARPYIKDLDTLPLPAWDLLPDLKRYYHPPGWSMHRGTSIVIMTSRGCHSQCTYCFRAVFGNYCRFHSAAYVIRMLRTLYDHYDMRYFRILDDNFVLHRRRVHEICDWIIENKLKVEWTCFARVDGVDWDMLRKMRRAGCTEISYGIESGSQKIHDIEKKKITIPQIEEAVRLTRKARIRVIAFNMIGHPLETIDTIKETIQFNKKIKVDDFKMQFLTPFPGTELYKTAEKFGKLDKDWSAFRVFDGPIFIPDGLTREELEYWSRKGMREFYLQPRIILSYITRLRTIDDLKTLAYGALTVLKMGNKQAPD